jgi:hypothetical protein
MKLSDFSYTTTNISELVEYSHWIPGTIALFNNAYSSPIGTISQIPCCGLSPEEDRLVYWDTSKDITYGRYLLFKNTKWEIIKFWTGFSASKTAPIYCIWFENKNPFTQYIGKLKKFGSNFHNSGNEIWITVVGTDITSQTIKDFWHDVLGELK